jgi:hypothetical protein
VSLTGLTMASTEDEEESLAVEETPSAAPVTTAGGLRAWKPPKAAQAPDGHRACRCHCPGQT